jgi:hypothetical protein
MESNSYLSINGEKLDFASQRDTIVTQGVAEGENFPEGGNGLNSCGTHKIFPPPTLSNK